MSSEVKQQLSKAGAAVLAAFAADAFSLNYHWVYDLSTIPHPLANELQEPASKYHKEKGKSKGDLTHLGDQMLLLLRQLKHHPKQEFDVELYAKSFGDLFNENYKGWLTGYTKSVLQQQKEKVPAAQITTAMGDTDPIGRIAPFFVSSAYSALPDGPAKLAVVAKQYVAFTNNTPFIIAATEFVSALTFAVLGGKSPVAAMQELIKIEPFSKSEELVSAVTRGIASKDQESTEAIKAFGNSCDIEGGFPGAVHLIAKYENDMIKLNEANVSAGGDSAARGLIAALVLGAHLGEAAVPPYAKQMKCYDEVVKLIQ